MFCQHCVGERGPSERPGAPESEKAPQMESCVPSDASHLEIASAKGRGKLEFLFDFLSRDRNLQWQHRPVTALTRGQTPSRPRSLQCARSGAARRQTLPDQEIRPYTLTRPPPFPAGRAPNTEVRTGHRAALIGVRTVIRGPAAPVLKVRIRKSGETAAQVHHWRNLISRDKITAFADILFGSRRLMMLFGGGR